MNGLTKLALWGALLAALMQTGLAESPGPAVPLPTRDMVQSFMRRMFGYDPAVTWQILEIRPSIVPNMAEIVVRVGNQPLSTRLYVTPDGNHAIIGDAVPFGADPFAPTRARLEREARGPARGPAGAAVTMVVFEDLQCPHCREAHLLLEKLLADYPDIRLVFQHYPLTEVHKWAFQAAAFAECVALEGNAAFWKFVQAVFDHQTEITEDNARARLAAYAMSAGTDGASVRACASSGPVSARVNQSLEFGRSLGVSSTPTLFINGRKVTQVNGIPYERLKALVEFEIRQGKQGGK